MFTVFWIVVVVVLSLDFIAAIVLCLIENKLKKQHPENENELALERVTTTVDNDKVYLQVSDGVVSIVDELPTIEVVKEVVKEVAHEVYVAAPVEKEEEAVVEEQPVAAVVEDEDTEMLEEVDENGRVVFIASNEVKRTYLDKLADLDKETYALYEELVNYLISKEGVKQITTNNKAIFKYKTDRLVISSVRRGILTLQFMLANSDLNRYMRAEGIKQIKVTPVVIRLTDEDSLAEAKSTADLTLKYLVDEREYNAEKKREARREARRAKAEAEAKARAAAGNADGDAE